jgi:hypothetical protein
MIATDQNGEGQILRLAAQRQLYSAAKTILGWQMFIGGPVAVMSAFLVLADPSWKSIAASWGILVTLCDIFWLTPWQKRLRDSAARIQEAFDCDVFELRWNDIKAGSRPDPELIKEQSDKYRGWASRMPPLTDWYAPIVSDLPMHIGRIACQRTNCLWDSKQRRRYAVGIVVFVALSFALVFGLSLRAGMTMEDFILKVVAPLAPALLLGMRQYSEQMEAAARLDRLKDHAERLWNDALSGQSPEEVTLRSRSLQDEILENRRKSPPVFDWIFKRLRPQYEGQMIFSVAELVTQAKQRGIQKPA